MENSALIPIRQQDVVFYDDVLTVVVVNEQSVDTVFVPLRPICDYLGVDWASQRQRINRDPVLAEELKRVVVTTTDIGKDEPKRR